MRVHAQGLSEPVPATAVPSNGTQRQRRMDSAHATFVLVSLAAKTTAGLAAVTIAGLVALAVPTFTSFGQAAHGALEGVTKATDIPESAPKPAAAESTPKPTPRDPYQASAWAAGCDDWARPGVYVRGEKPSPRPDRGPTEYASGIVTFKEDGGVDTYTVAEGDTGASIGERFCVDYMVMFIWNGVQQGTVHPGQVLKINP
ncbi:MAG: hypothetical protein K0R99_2731 [Microbacterium sp.]|nr:hypothetical protein [Microbacterium sp.]